MRLCLLAEAIAKVLQALLRNIEARCMASCGFHIVAQSALQLLSPEPSVKCQHADDMPAMKKHYPGLGYWLEPGQDGHVPLDLIQLSAGWETS